MSIFRQLREDAGITKYRAAKILGLMQNEYERLEKHETGERFLQLFLKLASSLGVKKKELLKLLEEITKVDLG